MSTESNPFSAKWSAEGHTLCLGHWLVFYKDKKILLPEPQATREMKTHGNFSWMFPDEEEFIEGLPLPEWVDANVDWLLEVFEQNDIPADPKHIEWFYQAVNEQDWTCNSCGGCL